MRTLENHSPDWSAIKADWLEGTQKIRALGRSHGVSDTAIRKRAKQENWPRLGAGAQSKCEPEREPEQNRKQKRTELPPLVTHSADADPKQLVKSGRVILDRLTRELLAVTENVEVIEDIIRSETEGDQHPRRREMLLRLVSLPTRIQASRNLAAALNAMNDAGPGKKQQAKDDAANVGGAGSPWGDDLNSGSAFPN